MYSESTWEIAISHHWTIAIQGTQKKQLTNGSHNSNQNKQTKHNLALPFKTYI